MEDGWEEEDGYGRTDEVWSAPSIYFLTVSSMSCFELDLVNFKTRLSFSFLKCINKTLYHLITAIKVKFVKLIRAHIFICLVLMRNNSPKLCSLGFK